jgi:N-acetylglucosamine-6-phosphate deacetylase
MQEAPPSPSYSPGVPAAARGRLLLDGKLEPGAVVFAGGRILQVIRGDAIPAERLPAQVFDAAIVTPGLIDLQVNGGFGFEVGADAAALRALAERLPVTGVTAFLPTLVSLAADQYPAALDAFEAAVGTVGASGGATPLGLHLEGPLLSPARAGAHDRAAIDAATPELIERAAARGCVRLVTVAPERPGALALIARLRAQGVTLSLGHTDATAAELSAGIDAGASMVTHLYNAMSPFSHRAPGTAGAALTDNRVVAGLIADGVHVDPLAIKLALAAKGCGRLALVTDATAAAGLGPGRHQLGGVAIVSDGKAARLASNPMTLAGSTLTLDQALRNFVSFTGAAIEDAFATVTSVPARLLGASDRGRLAPGARADLVLWSDALEVEATFFGEGGFDARAFATGA